MTDQIRVATISIKLSAYVKSPSAEVAEAVMRNVELVDLVKGVPNAPDWDGADYEANEPERENQEEDPEIEVLRVLPYAAGETWPFHIPVAYKLEDGKICWSYEYKKLAKDTTVVQPLYPHDCTDCVYLGQYLIANREVDLYYSKQCKEEFPVVLVRYGSEPADYTTASLDHIDDLADFFVWRPAMIEALNRVVERGLDTHNEPEPELDGPTAEYKRYLDSLTPEQRARELALIAEYHSEEDN